MAAPRIRPTFEITSELSSRELVAHLEARRERVAGSIVVTFPDESIELVPHPSKVHYWSPQLTLRMAEADGRTRIRGRFAPHPHVWTLYLAVHALGAFGTIGAAMYGISQYMVNEPPTALWALPLAPVLAALVWAFAFVGQGLGAEQMYELRRFVDESLDEAGETLRARRSRPRDA